MTVVESIAGVPLPSPGNCVPGSPDEIRIFLAAISTVLHETVAAFELTVGRITEITVSRPGKADRDLVVALQDFDRLQQEFATLGQVLHRLSNTHQDAADPQEAGHHAVIADISIADLKARLAHHLQALTSGLPEPIEEDVEF